jgi:hypothetical protein
MSIFLFSFSAAALLRLIVENQSQWQQWPASEGFKLPFFARELI